MPWSTGTDEAWEAVRPQGCSPLLVFVNSKSGDNQGVKFLRRFKQLLNPAQVFDLMNGGPGLGLRLFRHFDPFRILICSGDGSIGWVLSEIDKLHMDVCYPITKFTIFICRVIYSIYTKRNNAKLVFYLWALATTWPVSSAGVAFATTMPISHSCSNVTKRPRLKCSTGNILFI